MPPVLAKCQWILPKRQEVTIHWQKKKKAWNLPRTERKTSKRKAPNARDGILHSKNLDKKIERSTKMSTQMPWKVGTAKKKARIRGAVAYEANSVPFLRSHTRYFRRGWGTCHVAHRRWQLGGDRLLRRSCLMDTVTGPLGGDHGENTVKDPESLRSGASTN